jgi:flagellar biogenesis protein FliO
MTTTSSAVNLPGLRVKPLKAGVGLLSRAWAWFRAKQLAQSSTRRLRVAETVSLGEKRFVAVIQVDGQQFLIGGGATSVNLLAKLDANGENQSGAQQ